METKTKLTLNTLALIFLFSSINKSTAQSYFNIALKPVSTFTSSTTEDHINLSIDDVRDNDASTYKKNAQTGLLVNNKSLINRVFNLNTTIVRNILETEANKLGPNTGHYITALELTYGIDPSDGKTNTLYIRPLYLKYKSYNSSSNKTSYITNSNDDTVLYYKLDPKTGTLSAGVSKPADFALYQTKIMIAHDTNAASIPTPFQNGDILSVIFPFQEINSLLLANSTPTGIVPDSIQLVNILITDHINPTLLKHDILLAPPSKGEINYSTSTVSPNSYADLSNMCPPDCPSEAGVEYVIQ